jgi:thioredoxin-like negative regulator of GroEL
MRAFRDFGSHATCLEAAREAPPAAVLEAPLDASPDALDARFALAATRLVDDDVESALALFAEIRPIATASDVAGSSRSWTSLGEMIRVEDPLVVWSPDTQSRRQSGPPVDRANRRLLWRADLSL